MECDICLLGWDCQNRIPRLLSCGHTFCQICLLDILKSSISKGNQFKCPNCKSNQNIKEEKDILNLIKNYNLLSISEKIEIKNSMPKESSKKLINANTENEKENDSKIEYTLQFNIDKKCIKHNLPLHSYIRNTNTLLCDLCIKEALSDTNNNISISQNDIILLPNIYRALRANIDNSQIKACMTKNEINSLKLFLESYLTEFENENSKKIEKVFDYFYNVIKYFHNKEKQTLKGCVAEQRNKINAHINDMDKLLNELDKIENELVDIYCLPNNNLFLEKIEVIQEINHKLKNLLNYDWNFDLYSMEIGINQKEENNLFSAIKNSYFIDLDFLKIENEEPSVKNILKPGVTWHCICDELNNPNEEIKCSSCNLLRKFNNDLLCDVTHINENDIFLFNLRRQEERKEYESLLNQLTNKKNQNNDNKKTSHFDERFFIVDSNWFNLWKCYIKNDKKKYSQNGKNSLISYSIIDSINNQLIFSNEKQIGILPPGPITNFNLLKKINDDFHIKDNLKKNEHYIIVNKTIWDFFFTNYNGGPYIEISPSRKDIYSNLISIDKNEYFSYSELKKFLNISEENESSDNDENVQEEDYNANNNNNINNFNNNNNINTINNINNNSNNNINHIKSNNNYQNNENKNNCDINDAHQNDYNLNHNPQIANNNKENF